MKAIGDIKANRSPLLRRLTLRQFSDKMWVAYGDYGHTAVHDSP